MQWEPSSNVLLSSNHLLDLWGQANYVCHETVRCNAGLMKEMGKTTTGRLNNGVPQVPPSKAASELTAFQQGLPVYTMRDAITKGVNESRVLMVAGETGSGKTTQVINR